MWRSGSLEKQSRPVSRHMLASWLSDLLSVLTHALPAGGRWEMQARWMLFLFCGYFPTNVPCNFQRKLGNFKEMTQRGSRKSFSQTVNTFETTLKLKAEQSLCVCVCVVFTSSTHTWVLLTISPKPFHHFMLCSKAFWVINPLKGIWTEDFNLFWICIKIWSALLLKCFYPPNMTNSSFFMSTCAAMESTLFQSSFAASLFNYF